LIEGNFDQLPERRDTVFTTGNTLTVAFIVQGIKEMCALEVGRIAPHALVCDAGYPKNLSPKAEMPGATVFFGGLGQITGRMKFTPDFHGILNRHPFPDVVHGCLLEGMALALEGRFEPYSQGRGFITPERVEEVETIAARHGIYLAPLYNADGPLGDGLDTRWTGREEESPLGELGRVRDASRLLLEPKCLRG
jgi:predicted amino acid dehydrogenase